MTGVKVSGSDDVTQLVIAEPATGHSTIEWSNNDCDDCDDGDHINAVLIISDLAVVSRYR